jgi:3-methyladenine DNA glycosylase AlkD
MRSLAKPKNLAAMARFGITTSSALGLDTPTIRAFAHALCPGKCKDQLLAEELWKTGIRDARILASLIGDPQTITRSTMDRWTRDLDCWSVCDACCCDLFDRTPYVWQKIPKWAADKREFVRRAAFSTLAGAAVHRKQDSDEPFLDALPLIEKYAFDDRNFVRKAVNWALRNIGKRNARLLPAAIACAERVRAQATPSARRIAADAMREFRLKFGVSTSDRC